jgi:hypothetical protein
MRKMLLAAAAAATVAAGAMIAPPQAEARNGRIAAGVVGGLAAGAIVGGALASQPRYYGGPAYYSSYGAYGGPPCRFERQRVWDGFRWRIQRVQVCY